CTLPQAWSLVLRRSYEAIKTDLTIAYPQNPGSEAGFWRRAFPTDRVSAPDHGFLKHSASSGSRNSTATWGATARKALLNWPSSELRQCARKPGSVRRRCSHSPATQ